jgi:hypothetical protein
MFASAARRAERPNGRRAKWREAKQAGGLRVTPQACLRHDASEGLKR